MKLLKICIKVYIQKKHILHKESLVYLIILNVDVYIILYYTPCTRIHCNIRSAHVHLFNIIKPKNKNVINSIKMRCIYD